VTWSAGIIAIAMTGVDSTAQMSRRSRNDAVGSVSSRLGPADPVPPSAIGRGSVAP